MHSTFVNLVFNTRPAGGGIIILPWRVMNFVLRREKMITAHPVNSRVNNNIMRDILSSFQLSTFHCFVYTMFNHRCKFESLDNGRAARTARGMPSIRSHSSRVSNHGRGKKKLSQDLCSPLHTRKLAPQWSSHGIFRSWIALCSRYKPVTRTNMTSIKFHAVWHSARIGNHFLGNFQPWIRVSSKSWLALTRRRGVRNLVSQPTYENGEKY